MTLSLEDLLQGSVHTVRHILEAKGLDAASVEASLGWSQGRYEDILRAPGKVTLEDYITLVLLATGHPTTDSITRLHLRPQMRTISPRASEETASDMDPIQAWIFLHLLLINAFVQMDKTQAPFIARILADSLLQVTSIQESTLDDDLPPDSQKNSR